MNTPVYTKISQEFKNSGINNDLMFKQIRDFLITNNVQDIEMTSDALSFKISIFGWTWDYFSYIERGKFTIIGNKLFFEFRMSRLVFIFTTLIILAYLQTKNVDVVFFFLGVAIVIWLLAILRYKKMLKEILNALP